MSVWKRTFMLNWVVVFYRGYQLPFVLSASAPGYVDTKHLLYPEQLNTFFIACWEQEQCYLFWLLNSLLCRTVQLEKLGIKHPLLLRIKLKIMAQLCFKPLPWFGHSSLYLDHIFLPFRGEAVIYNVTEFAASAASCRLAREFKGSECPEWRVSTIYESGEWFWWKFLFWSFLVRT